jgi:hypothetical protein
MDLKRIIFKNSDSDSNTEAGHTHSGRAFREVHLANLFKKNYRDEGFYSGEEAYLIDEEISKSVRIEEPRREEPKTSGTPQTVEVSTGTLPVVSVALSNQSKLSHQSIVTSSLPHTQFGEARREFRGYQGSSSKTRPEVREC